MMCKFPNRLAILSLAMLAGSAPALAATAGAAAGNGLRPPLAAPASAAADLTAPAQSQAMLMLNYQTIPVPGDQTLDLIGFHVLKPFNDWLYLGVGGQAPLFRGEYGGFMTFDVTAHVQRKLLGQTFVAGGVSFGGGGGGRSVEQSTELSGTGGFVKGYLGLGHDFGAYALGANVAKMRFFKSKIDSTQLNVFLQVPFSYTTGPFWAAGQPVPSRGDRTGDDRPTASETMLTVGTDNYTQIDPVGSFKGPIGTVDLQYAHFLSAHRYWFFNAAGGYRGRPLYNQALAGVGWRQPLTQRTRLYAQLGLGSGGYAPEIIDTGPGLLLFPRVSLEYMLTRNIGLAASGGYLYAPKATSRNRVLGLALNYHIQSGTAGAAGSDAAGGRVYSGYRVNLFHQRQFNVQMRRQAQPDLQILSVQIDKVLGEHLFLPLQVSVATNAYLGFPGYGELLMGVGVQTRNQPQRPWQFFAQFMGGANVHGRVMKTGAGLHYGLSDRLALHAVLGQTFARPSDIQDRFKSDYAGLGLSYRFAVPGW